MVKQNNARKSLSQEVAANTAKVDTTSKVVPFDVHDDAALDAAIDAAHGKVEDKAKAEVADNAAKENLKDELKSLALVGPSEEVVSQAKAEAASETTGETVDLPAFLSSTAPVAASVSNGFVIEDNIPMPGAGTGGNRGKYPWNDLKVGQSFFVAGAKVETFYTLCSSQKKKTGWTYQSRKVDGGVRVWRTA